MPVTINMALRSTLAELTASIIELEQLKCSINDRIEGIQDRIDSIRAELKTQKA